MRTCSKNSEERVPLPSVIPARLPATLRSWQGEPPERSVTPA